MSLSDRQLFLAVGRGDCEKVQQLLLNQKVAVNQSPRHQVFQSLSLSFCLFFCVAPIIICCVLSCDIDLKVLRKERDYSFDESL